MKVQKTPKKRNPLARVLWNPQYRRTVENKLVYKRQPKHKLEHSELV